MQRYKKYDILHSQPKFRVKSDCTIYHIKASNKSNIITDVPDEEDQVLS